MSKPDVVLSADRSRFELEDEGETAFLRFTREGNAMTLVHTEVPDRLEGRGIGTALVRAAIDYTRGNDLAVVARCPFVVSYLKRHPDEAREIGIDPSTL